MPSHVARPLIDARARPRVASFAAGVAVWNGGGRYGARGWCSTTHLSRSSGGQRIEVRGCARLGRERMTRSYTGVGIATFRCSAHARCDAFADERRIVAGAECGCVRTRMMC